MTPETDEETLSGKIIDFMVGFESDVILDSLVTAFIALNNHYALSVDDERLGARHAADRILEAAEHDTSTAQH